MAQRIDRHVSHTLAFRLWQVLFGLVMLALVPTFLRTTEQGYYFTFGSILALQMFFELGLNTIIVQFVAHAVSALDSASRDHDDDAAAGAVRSLAAVVGVSKLWYGAAATAFFALSAVAGYLYFERYRQSDAVHWQTPWLVLCAATAANLLQSPRLSVLEGKGFVSDVARMRLHQAALGSVLAWGLLVGGQGLAAVVATPMTAALYTAAWLRLHRLPRQQLRLDHQAGVGESIGLWRREILPLQLRMSVSWFAGYFAYQLFVPTAFSAYGARAAGQLGLGITASNAIVGLSMAWINAKSPEMAHRLAAGRPGEARRLFSRHMNLSLLLNIVCWIMVLTAHAVVVGAGWPVQDKMPSPTQLALIAANAILSHAVFSYSTYFRAHKHEPTTRIAVLQALLVVALLQFSGTLSLTQILAGNLAVTALIVAPCTWLIDRRYRGGGAS